MFIDQGNLSCRLKKNVMMLSLIAFLTFSAPYSFAADRTTTGALLGATAGVLTGNGLNGALKGAALGAGVGAVSEKGKKGKDARKGMKIGAAAGAVAGVLSGNGLDGAIKGAVIGGTGGAIIGRMK